MLKLFLLIAFWTPLSFATSQTPEILFNSLPAKSIKGQKNISFSDLKNKVILVDFWASWCEPCKEALPHYESLYKKFQSKGLVFLAINEDDDSSERDLFLKKVPLTCPVLSDTEKKMAKNFNVLALPTLFLFDQKMKLVKFYRGFDEKNLPSLEKDIQQLLDKKN